jgi:hypothetical protein
MKVKELIAKLNDEDPECPAIIMYGKMPLDYITIESVSSKQKKI